MQWQELPVIAGSQLLPKFAYQPFSFSGRDYLVSLHGLGSQMRLTAGADDLKQSGRSYQCIFRTIHGNDRYFELMDA